MSNVIFNGNSVLYYRVPGTSLIIGFVVAGSPSHPAHEFSQAILIQLLAHASAALEVLENRHHGWDRNIQEDFLQTHDRIKLHVWGNREQTRDWPRYKDVWAVLKGLRDKLPGMGFRECVFSLHRGSRLLKSVPAIGYGYLYNENRYLSSVNESAPSEHGGQFLKRKMRYDSQFDSKS